MNLQFGQGLDRTAHLCSTQQQLEGLKGWGLQLYKASFTNLVVDAVR